MRPEQLRHLLDTLYARYHRPEFISPDPLQFVHQYENPADQEVVGLIAASLAFGGVNQIVKTVASVLERMPYPARFLAEATPESLHRTFDGFRYRFVGETELCGFLHMLARVRERHGSLRECFVKSFDQNHDSVIPALTAFVHELRGVQNLYLLPSPADGSACKRLNLFLRWMVRKDAVDPGVWAPLPAVKLVMPLNLHIHRTALALGLTARAQPNLRTALEVTAALRVFAPEDPVRYDFALTRASMAGDEDLRCS